MEVTNIDSGSVAIRDEVHKDEILTLAAPATLKEGTILARDSVSQKLVIFVVGGATNENGIAKAVLTHEFTGGTGDHPIQPLVGGVVAKERLVVHAAGDDSTLTTVHLEQLRQVTIVAVKSKQLSSLDTQEADS